MNPSALRYPVVISEMFAENAYLAHLDGSNACLVIDPGLDWQEILDRLAALQLEPAAILNTHGHADHIGGNSALKQAWPDSPLIIGHSDAPKLTEPMQNLSGQFGIPITSPPADQQVREGDTLSLAGIDLEVLETPGHSVGHVIFVWKGGSPWVVFGGDVLFREGIGRTDFPDGSFEQLASSIQQKLYTLPDDTIVLPGHGDATTIGHEKRFNPFVRG